MGWKDVLNYDLGRLAGGAPAKDAAGARRYWWVALWRIFSRPTPHHGDPQGAGFSARAQRRAADAGWKGPVYWNAWAWRRDIALVAEQLRGLIACNMPLAPGLAAAAREEGRIRTGWSPQRASALLRNLAVFCVFVLLCAGIALEPNGFSSTQAVVLGLCALFLIAWFIRAVVLNRNSRTDVFLALERRIALGMPLSQAMGTLPRFFPRHLADLVEAGEEAGNLDRAFDQFSDAMLRSLGLHRQLKAALLYIKVVLSIQVLIVLFILVKIVPVWAEVLQELGSEGDSAIAGVYWSPLPLLGAIIPDLDQIVSLSEALFTWNKVLLPAVILPLVWAFLARFRRRRSWASRGASSVLLLLPWFRGLVSRHNLGLIARMLHGLLLAGVPLDRALAMAMGADLLPPYRNWLGDLRDRIQQGDSIADALAAAGGKHLIPDSFRGLLEAGERSGQLPATLERIAELYQREAEKRMHVLVALVLPSGIFVMAYITLCVQTIVFGSMARMIDTLLI